MKFSFISATNWRRFLFALQSELLNNKRIDMIIQFFRNRRKGENELDLSEIKIIGVGNGGTNVINHLQTHGVKEDSLCVCDMDAMVLKHSIAQHRLLLGQKGLGAGNNPELGYKESIKKIHEIRTLIEQPHPEVAFIVACLGGGCGTGASPVVAGECKSLGIKTIGVVTLPFEFEGEHKFHQAIAGLTELAKNTDAMFVLNNQYLLNHHQDLSMMDAFTRADALACVAIRSIMDDL